MRLGVENPGRQGAPVDITPSFSLHVILFTLQKGVFYSTFSFTKHPLQAPQNLPEMRIGIQEHSVPQKEWVVEKPSHLVNRNADSNPKSCAASLKPDFLAAWVKDSPSLDSVDLGLMRMRTFNPGHDSDSWAAGLIAGVACYSYCALIFFLH